MEPPEKKSRNSYGETDESENSDEINIITETLNPLNKKLRYAAHKGNLEFVRSLIRDGADVNAKIEGKTALHLAVLKGHTNMVNFLIKHNANIHHHPHHVQYAIKAEPTENPQSEATKEEREQRQGK